MNDRMYVKVHEMERRCVIEEGRMIEYFENQEFAVFANRRRPTEQHRSQLRMLKNAIIHGPRCQELNQ